MAVLSTLSKTQLESPSSIWYSVDSGRNVVFNKNQDDGQKSGEQNWGDDSSSLDPSLEAVPFLIQFPTKNGQSSGCGKALRPGYIILNKCKG